MPAIIRACRSGCNLRAGNDTWTVVKGCRWNHRSVEAVNLFDEREAAILAIRRAEPGARGWGYRGEGS